MVKKSYQDLLIWKKADEIYDMVCEDVKKWPHDSIANSLRYQLLDSAASVSSNIAEGYGRGSPREFEQFIRVSRGSLSESDNWLFKAKKQDLISERRYLQYVDCFEEWKRMVAAFVNALRKQSKR